MNKNNFCIFKEKGRKKAILFLFNWDKNCLIYKLAQMGRSKNIAG